MGWLNWILGVKCKDTETKAKPKSKSKSTTAALMKAKVPSKVELAKLSKIDLEKLGREHGIELDRRLVKRKLVTQLHAYLKKG
jgi:hypothetical protein